MKVNVPQEGVKHFSREKALRSRVVPRQNLFMLKTRREFHPSQRENLKPHT